MDSMSNDLTQSDMNQAQAFFRGTQTLCQLAATKVIPVLSTVISPTDYEEALIPTYYRMQHWLLALGKLDHPQHFQTVMNAARGIYELLLDLKFLNANPSYA